MIQDVTTLIELALEEDVGTGDVTSLYFVEKGRRVEAYVVARQEGVVSGVDLAEEVFLRVDGDLEVTQLIADGSKVAAGAMVLKVAGEARSILTAERTALNFLQRLSGVASLARRYVDEVAGLQVEILDTRKTTPGYRFLEKRAVAHGGATNHRMGLYDRAMVKDNHLVSEGSLDALRVAIARLAEERPEVEVEVEADSLEQVEAFFGMDGIDYILLDNMNLEQMREAVRLRGGRVTPQLEASGGVNLDTVRAIAETGVDFVSVGGLTHSAPAMDFGLDFMQG